eukprot:7325531-Alexandrium_andersonii.AAC.1
MVRSKSAATFQRSRGSAPARPRPAEDVLWHGSAMQTMSALAIVCQWYMSRMSPTTACSAPRMPWAQVERKT